MRKIIALLLALALALTLCACGGNNTDRPTNSIGKPDPNPGSTPGETAEAVPEPDSTPAALTEIQNMWNGWWYGCIDLSDCENSWEWADGMTFDAAMYVALDGEGNGTLELYDVYGDFAPGANYNRFAVIDCHADTSYLYGDSGTAFGADIDPADWRIVHNLDNANKLNVGSSFADNDGSMDYDLTFLPWGDRWETETYQRFIPHFNEYLDNLDVGWNDPFGTGMGLQPDTPVQDPDEPAATDAPSSGDSGSSGELSPLLGSNPTRLDVNNRGIVYVYYPADQFRYDSDYGKLKNDDTYVGILIDPMLGASNFEELRSSYETNNSDEDDYSLTETTINGYRAMIMTYSDWLGATMRVDIDFGGNHDGWYGISFAVSGDSLADCNTDLVWAIIQSMEVVK